MEYPWDEPTTPARHNGMNLTNMVSKRNEPDTRGDAILYDSIFMKFKNRQNESVLLEAKSGDSWWG